MDKQKIIFRADGNSAIGLGHFFRVLALADLLKEIYDCFIAIQEPDDFVKIQIGKKGIGLIQLEAFNYKKPLEKEGDEEIPFDLEKSLQGSEIVVLDGYWFGNNYQRNLKKIGCTVVYIDDVCQEYPYADVVINHALSAFASQYKNTSAKILAGPDYCLMRKEFLEAAQKKVLKNKFDTVFICFGGADTEELAFKVSSLLVTQFSDIRIVHILNSSSYKGDIGKFAQIGINTNKKIILHQNISAEEIVALMTNSDFAIVSASNSAYECVCTGLPMVTGYYVNNQIQFYNALIQQSNIKGVGQWQKVTPEILKLMVEKLIHEYNPNAKKIIDGFQQKRFIDLFKSLKRPNAISAL